MKLFVYGTLKKEFHNHWVLGNATFVGYHTTKPNYTMYDMGAYPSITMEGNTAIVGEVYELESLDHCDQLEGYPMFYDRTEIETEYGLVWVYHYFPSNRKVIETGIWK